MQKNRISHAKALKVNGYLCFYNKILGNNITDNLFGVTLDFNCTYNKIIGNIFDKNLDGIILNSLTNNNSISLSNRLNVS